MLSKIKVIHALTTLVFTRSVSDTLSPKILNFAETSCLYLQDGGMFIWALPQSMLTAGRSVTEMT